MSRFVAIGMLLVAMLGTLAVAQEPQPAAPQKEHEWLKQFVGEWTTDAESVAAPGMEPVKCTGTIKGRMLGDLWVINEAEMSPMGIQVRAIQTIGYDPAKKKYIGTWVDSMMNHLWHYEGTIDDSGKILTLEAEGPSFAGDGKTAKYRDVYEIKSKDHIVALSQMQGENGEWVTFMKGNARRK